MTETNVTSDTIDGIVKSFRGWLKSKRPGRRIAAPKPTTIVKPCRPYFPGA